MLNNKRLYLIAGILWFIVSIILLTLPGNDLPKITWMDTFQIDKLVHITMFFLLSFLFMYPLKDNHKAVFQMFLVATAGLAYGIAMEFVQKYYIPNRTCDINDMIADGIGAFAGFFWWLRILKKKNRSIV
jgi:VanZ family protein